MLLTLKFSSIVNLSDQEESIAVVVSVFLKVLETVSVSIEKFKDCANNMTVIMRILSIFKELIFS